MAAMAYNIRQKDFLYIEIGIERVMSWRKTGLEYFSRYSNIVTTPKHHREASCCTFNEARKFVDIKRLILLNREIWSALPTVFARSGFQAHFL